MTQKGGSEDEWPDQATKTMDNTKMASTYISDCRIENHEIGELIYL